jgi:hypothetical protein
MHIEKCIELGIVMVGSSSSSSDASATIVKRPFDDPKNFEQNIKLLNYLEAKALPLSHCECPQLRAYAESLDPKSSPCCVESMNDIQEAKRMAQKEQLKSDLEKRRADGHWLGGQFDMWRRHGRQFVSFNYTYLDLDFVVTADKGKIPCWVVKASVLDFASFEESHTAANIRSYLERALVDYELTWADFSIIVPDGASNCTATLALLVNDVPSDVCYCHNLARSILTALGMGASLSAEDRELIQPLTVALTKQRALSVRFHRSTTLSKSLHEAQAAAGVEHELEPDKGSITRWNAIYIGTQRNIQLYVYIGSVLTSRGTINVLTFNDDGEAVLIEVHTSSLSVDPMQWLLSCEICAVLKVAFVATQRLEGLIMTPDKSFMILSNLHRLLKDAREQDMVFKIPVPAASGTTQVTYVDRNYSSLQNAVKAAARVLENQLYQRFILPGPCITNMRAIKLNPEFPKSVTFLTVAQNNLADVHVKTLLDICDAEMAPATSPLEVPVVSTLVLIAAAPAVESSGFDLLDIGEERFFEETEEGDEIDPLYAARKAEDVLWSSMPKSDFNCGVFQEIVKGRVQRPKFNVMAFYANPYIIGKYPRHFRAFKKVFAAINHEATSEGTFSFSGQVFSKLRTQLDPERLCRTIVNVAGEKRKATDSAAIHLSYKQLKKQRVLGKRQALEAAAVKASAAAAAAAAAADAAAADFPNGGEGVSD